ncbi:MAG: fumarate reductase/succinate dehydrogenase flavoprotein subunit, partial [Dissulfuribacterales bacterium]
SALMQGLADGYFVIPYTIGGYLAQTKFSKINLSDSKEFKQGVDEVQARINKLLSIKGKRTVSEFHRELGLILWDHCGMSRNEESLSQALSMINHLKHEFWENVYVPGIGKDFNQSLENAGRVADFLEFGELMINDALARKESCGCHFNTAFQTEENEAKRDDENYCHVAAWEYTGEDQTPDFHKEPLSFENVELTRRSYK